MAGRDTTRIVALGGLGEIGMNCLALEAQERILIVDCGVMFSSEGLGVDLIHPGFEWLVARRDDLVGLVLTHGHEDHVAGVPFLLRELDVPLFASPYALGLVRERAVEVDGCPTPKGRYFLPGGRLDLGPFAVRSFSLPHSVVENMAFVIDSPGGRILFTGDHKLELGDAAQAAPSLAALREACADGIDLVIADSTAAEEDEPSRGEGVVEEALDRLVGGAAGRVYVAIFSSNVKRLQAILDVARRHDRRVALAGRSVEMHARLGQGLGHLDPPPGLLVPLDEVSSLPPDRILVVVSGTQGEARAALTRLADATHRELTVGPDDLVILSSRFIPGNELAIGQVIDRLLKRGARVIHRGVDPRIHVSGHGSRPELKLLLETIRPRAFLPAHGSLRHLDIAATVAREAGVPSVVVATDGEIVELSGGTLAPTGEVVPTRRVHLSGARTVSEQALRERRVLAGHGVVIVALATDAGGRPTGQPAIATRGVVSDEELPEFLGNLGQVVTRVLGELAPADRGEPPRWRELVRTSLRRHLQRHHEREPFVIIQVV